MQAYGTIGALPGLPDPEIDREFYEGVPARRLVAWFVDVILILAMGVFPAMIFGVQQDAVTTLVSFITG